jgi:hypothetical protein
VVGERYGALMERDSVEFETVQGGKSPQASKVVKVKREHTVNSGQTLPQCARGGPPKGAGDEF